MSTDVREENAFTTKRTKITKDLTDTDRLFAVLVYFVIQVDQWIIRAVRGD